MKSGRAGWLLLLLLFLSSTITQVHAIGSTTFYPGVVYHSMAGGGDITFAAAFTSTHMSYSGNYIVFTDFTWAGINFGTLGFMCPATASYVVTLVSSDEVDIMTTVTVPATVLGIYAPGKGSPTSASGSTSFSYASDYTTLIMGTGIVSIKVIWGGTTTGGGGSVEVPTVPVVPVVPPVVPPVIPPSPVIIPVSPEQETLMKTGVVAITAVVAIAYTSKYIFGRGSISSLWGERDKRGKKPIKWKKKKPFD